MSRILLIIGGGIAAYKSLEFIRLCRREGHSVATILTEGGAAFIRPLSIAALSGAPVRQELFSAEEESTGIGHIALSRDADVIVVAPATANLLAGMRAGLANDLATATLLATPLDGPPILVAPAMNPAMWDHPATQENCRILAERGMTFAGPDIGDMACGETGAGRLIDPEKLLSATQALLAASKLPLTRHSSSQSLAGRRILVTSGPTREALDPVRYFSNYSSGKQGHAIAQALQQRGADVCLVSGPVEATPPQAVRHRPILAAQELYETCLAEIRTGYDAAICVAAVADWRPKTVAEEKLKKGDAPPMLSFEETPDCLHAIAHDPNRPKLVIGFAAETSAHNPEDLVAKASEKRKRKGCDWIFANDVSLAKAGGPSIFGAETTRLIKITSDGATSWGEMSKQDAAGRIADDIAKVIA